MNVTSTPIAAASARASQPPAAPNGKAEPDEFQASSPDKHRIGYEVAYNFGSAAGAIFKGVSKAGQFVNLSSAALGMQPGGISGSLGLLGGTLDIAMGASIAKQSAVNRNSAGCTLGSLQVAQGVATYAAIGSAMLGGTAIGRAASIGALGLMAARYGLEGAGWVGAHLHKGEEAKPADAHTPGSKAVNAAGLAALPALSALAEQTSHLDRATFVPSEIFHTQAAIQEDAAEHAENEAAKQGNRKFEKTFAAADAVDKWAQSLGGIGVLWNNFDAIRGTAPSGIWGPLGLIGSTYTLAYGIGGLKNAAVNHNLESTVTGGLDVIQGLGSVGASMGMGRAAGIVAAGAWAGKQAYTMYAQAHRLGVGGHGKTMTGTIVENLKNSFWGPAPAKA